MVMGADGKPPALTRLSPRHRHARDLQVSGKGRTDGLGCRPVTVTVTKVESQCGV